MQNIYGAIQVLILLAVPYVIVASLLVILGLALDLPGHVRKVQASFRRANQTVKGAQHDWESVYREDR